MRSRATAVVALLIALTGVAPAVHAQSTSNLENAKNRLIELEDRITREEAAVRSLQTQLRNLSISVAHEQGGLSSLRRDLGATTASVNETKARLQALRDRLRARARAMYMRGPLQLISVFLGSESIDEFVGRAAYASRLARRDGELVLKAREAQAKLRRQQAEQRRLEQAQATKVSSLRSRQNTLTNLFAKQMGVMAELAKSRAEALRLVVALQDKLGIDNLRRVAGHGMTISYGEWATSLLTSLGAPVSRSNLVAVVAWEAAEGTMATWNPLATTIAMPGATTYNSSGVRNYLSRQQGIEASILTLRRPGHGYQAIVDGLKSGADSMDTGRAINRSDWCRGCAGGTYVVGFIPAVERYYDRFAN